MLSKCYYSFALAALFSLSAYAESHHHDRHEEKVEIKIDAGHCHKKERSFGEKVLAGGVQVVENNAYLLNFGIGAAVLVTKINNGMRDRDLPRAALITAAIWLGGGMATRNILRAVMSQCNIPKL